MTLRRELSSLARAGVNAAVFVISSQVYAIEQDFVDGVFSATPKGPVLVEVVIPKRDLPPQLRRPAGPPPKPLRRRRAETPVDAV